MLHTERPIRIAAWPDPSGFSGADVLRCPPGTLDLDQRAHLSELADRVRVAHDLMLAFGERYATFPTRFADAQEREVALLHALMNRYALTSGGAGPVPGRFASPAAQTDYDRLLARGRLRRAEAARALADALSRVLALIDGDLPHMSAPDVYAAYTRLCAATIRQLRSVQAWNPR